MEPTGLLTDRYEIAMISSLLHNGKAHTPAVFEAFARKLPQGRRYGVVAGLERIVEAIQNFTFPQDELTWLQHNNVIDQPTATWLKNFQFTGDVDAYKEGDLYFPNSPIITVSGELAQCIILETIILSILNHDIAVASAASRIVHVAEGRPLIEMGSRRTHEQAAVAAARATYLSGFTATSNLQAGYTYGIPTMGTAAHAFILAHRAEEEAFAAQIAQHGIHTTLLVDTYDTEQGIRNAIAVAGTQLDAVRLDSGDLAVETRKARELLDNLGATNTKIVVTSDLDEYTIQALKDSPADAYGVGTRVVTGSGHPTASMVYKLVAIGDTADKKMRTVEKKSLGKISYGGHKTAYRTYDDNGHMLGEHLTTHRETIVQTSNIRFLQTPTIRNGEILSTPTLEEIRTFHKNSTNELTIEQQSITHSTAAFTAQPILGEKL